MCKLGAFRGFMLTRELDGQPEMKCVFEVMDLAVASPATGTSMHCAQQFPEML